MNGSINNPIAQNESITTSRNARSETADGVNLAHTGVGIVATTNQTAIEDELLEEIKRLDPDGYQRLKTPLGGTTYIQVADPIEGDRAEKELVINPLAYRKSRRRFNRSVDESGGGVPPDCAAYDGISGAGDPGGVCATCPFSQPGSGRSGKGQACEERLDVYFLRQGRAIPEVFSFSPSSARAIMPTVLAIRGSGVPLHVFLLKLRFREASSGGKRFAVAELTVAGKLDPEQMGFAERASRIIQDKIEAKMAAWSANKE